MPAEGSHMVRRGVLFPSQRICCAFSVQALAHRPLHVSRLPRPPLMLTTHSMRGGGETLTRPQTAESVGELLQVMWAQRGTLMNRYGGLCVPVVMVLAWLANQALRSLLFGFEPTPEYRSV